MVSKKVIIAIAVVAILAVIAVAVAGGSEEKTEARYNYTVELSDGFEWKGSSGDVYIQKPDDGKQYAILKYTVYNDSYDEDISISPLIWCWDAVIDGVSYSDSSDEFMHPGYQSSASVVKGGHATQTLVFEIPKEAALSDVSMTHEYIWTFAPPGLERDESIAV